jgi:hypothetical protein
MQESGWYSLRVRFVALALAVTLACGGSLRDEATMTAEHLDALMTPERSRDVEAIYVRLDGGTAHCRVLLRNTNKRQLAIVPFTTALVDKIYAARIPYSVQLIDAEDSRAQLDATTFRSKLDAREVADIAEIRVEPTSLGSATYVITFTSGGTRVVHAEYPGTIVPAIQAAKVRFR